MINRTLQRAVLFAAGLCALPVAAQPSAPNRVWVSVSGSDVAGCYAADNPCRSFQYAQNLIAPGGEIDVAAPGGYGPVVITKALTINGNGVGPATILAPSGRAITINAGAGDGVFLNGLSIDGALTGANGIVLNQAGSLTVTNCTIRHFHNSGLNDGNGIAIIPTAGSVVVSVSNSVLSDNGYAGLMINPASGSPNITAFVDGVTAQNDIDGLMFQTFSAAGGTNNYHVQNSNLVGNQIGIFFARGADTASLTIKGNTIANNAYDGIDNMKKPNTLTSFGGNVLTNNNLPINGAAPLTASPL